jgi:hypothetical protein
MTTQTKILPPAASPRSAVTAILGISIAATLFLLWLIFLHSMPCLTDSAPPPC